jgi:hypothetical protein
MKKIIRKWLGIEWIHNAVLELLSTPKITDEQIETRIKNILSQRYNKPKIKHLLKEILEEK